MAAVKLLVLAVFIILVLPGVGVDADVSTLNADDGASDSATLEQLKGKIRGLEKQVEEKTQEIKDKDTIITANEKTIKEKLDRVVSLESEVEELKKDLNLKIKETEQLKSHITEADQRASELNSKVDNLQKIIDDQKINNEKALKYAEVEIVKAKLEATSKTNQMMEIHGAWLPPWLAAHFSRYQLLLRKKWEVHGKPYVDVLTQKATEKTSCVVDWVAPYVEMMRSKCVPVIEKQWVVVEPHVRKITTKTFEIFETSKKTIALRVITVLEFVDPYFQELRKVTEPYIDRVVIAARPHVDSLHTTLKPYTQPTVYTCGKFLESATSYHQKVQERVQEKLEGHELTKPFATKELVWFSASSLLALPVIFLTKIYAAIFR